MAARIRGQPTHLCQRTVDAALRGTSKGLRLPLDTLLGRSLSTSGPWSDCSGSRNPSSRSRRELGRHACQARTSADNTKECRARSNSPPRQDCCEGTRPVARRTPRAAPHQPNAASESKTAQAERSAPPGEARGPQRTMRPPWGATEALLPVERQAMVESARVPSSRAAGWCTSPSCDPACSRAPSH